VELWTWATSEKRTNHKTANCKSRITNHKSQITNHKPQITTRGHYDSSSTHHLFSTYLFTFLFYHPILQGSSPPYLLAVDQDYKGFDLKCVKTRGSFQPNEQPSLVMFVSFTVSTPPRGTSGGCEVPSPTTLLLQRLLVPDRTTLNKFS
jgi:hypothetical protein